MKAHFTKHLAAASVLALASSISTTAHAQQDADATPATVQQAPAPDEEAGDIVVTAQRRTERLQDVPVAVSVVSGAALERSNLKTLEDVSARLPNVKITSGPLVDQINIRGVGSGQNAGFEQSVATFVDGIYRSRSRSTRVALFDVDRLEVLKGPQTTFFGANAIAGALNITTRKPGDTFAYNASALYAFEDGEYNFEAGLDLPVSSDFAVRVAGRISGMDGYIKNDLTGKDGPHDRSEQARVSAKWTPSSSFRSDLRFDISRSRTKDAFSFELLDCPPPSPIVEAANNTCARYLAANGGNIDSKLNYHSVSPPNYANFDFYEAAWTNSLDVGSGSLNSITGYLHQKYDELIQPIPFPVPGAVGGTQGLPVYAGERFHQFSQELRYQSQTGGTFEYMFGGYYSTSRTYNYNDVGFFFLPFGAFNPSGTTDATTQVTGRPAMTESDRTLSAFASATIRPADGLRINLGARYSSIHKHAVRDTTLGTSVNAVPSTYAPFDPVTDAIFSNILGADLGQFAHPSRTDTKFMPSVNLQYDLAHDVMAYVSYTKGFKAGGYSPASLANDYKPETVDAYEAGLKAQFLDRRLTMNTALFRSDYSNLQESTIVISTAGTIISLIQNAAKSRSQGVEFNASYRFSPMLTISTDLAYLDAKYTSYPAGACTALGNYLSATCVQDLSGKRRPYAPEWSGNVTANLTIPVGEHFDLRVDPSVYFSSKFFESATADPLLQQKGYTKVDLHLGFGPSDQKWELSLIGKNLTNKATAGYRQQVTLSSSIYAFPDRPRSIALQFSIKG